VPIFRRCASEATAYPPPVPCAFSQKSANQRASYFIKQFEGVGDLGHRSLLWRAFLRCRLVPIPVLIPAQVVHKLIESVRDLTGIPMVLNTSFNENEPVVCEPQEALDCFLRTKMDALILGDVFIARRGSVAVG